MDCRLGQQCNEKPLQRLAHPPLPVWVPEGNWGGSPTCLAVVYIADAGQQLGFDHISQPSKLLLRCFTRLTMSTTLTDYHGLTCYDVQYLWCTTWSGEKYMTQNQVKTRVTKHWDQRCPVAAHSP